MTGTKAGFAVDQENNRLVITTITDAGYTGRLASATYIHFSDMNDPYIMGEFMCRWGNAWFKRIGDTT